MTAAVLLCLLLAVSSSYSAKILLAPIDHHSHVNLFSLVGDVLKGEGHEVHVLSYPRHQKTLEKTSLKPIIFNTQIENMMSDSEKFMAMAMEHGQNPIALFNKVGAAMVDLCDEMYTDQAFLSKLKDEKYDLVMVDGVDFFRCIYILPYILDVRYVTLTARHDPWSARVSSLPSAENLTPLFGFADPTNPTFIERVKNMAMSIGVYNFMPPAPFKDELIEKYAPARPKTTFLQLFQGSEIFFVNLETVCLDWPRVGAAHYVFLGGMGLQPPKPLTAEFADFVADAEHGVIVMTFGSALKKIPMEKLEIMLDAYKKVKQKVIMRYDGPAPKNIPANVKLSKWLPQNDLLGHPKTKLFITHGGNNGQMEAVFHGVPMVTVPVFGDQFYNGERVAAHKFGHVVDYRTMTSEALYDAMHSILSDPSYQARIKSCSEKFHAMPSTADTLSFWTNHIIKFGGDHLKPKYMDMPMWKFFGLDILFILGECFHFGIHGVKYVVVTLLFFIIRKIRGSGGEKKKKE